MPRLAIDGKNVFIDNQILMNNKTGKLERAHAEGRTVKSYYQGNHTYLIAPKTGGLFIGDNVPMSLAKGMLKVGLIAPALDLSDSIDYGGY